MKISKHLIQEGTGFTLIELLMVFVLMGSLASIAIPHYTNYRQKALAAQCLANRYHIEMEERAYFSEHEETGLKIDDRYICPSGGVYVWLILDPEDPGYPQIGCSGHFTGSASETDIPAEEVPPGPVPPADETPDIPEPEEEEISPVQLIEDLIAYIDNLDLAKNAEKKLLSALNSAKSSIEKGKTGQAIDKINQFIETAGADTGNTGSGEADVLLSRGEEILDLLK